MRKLGLKLWSSNLQYHAEAKQLAESGAIQYIELYTIPGTERFMRQWKQINCPYIIHSPHEINLSHKALRRSNRVLMEKTMRNADTLKAKYIIYHPGMDGDEAEIANQLRQCQDERALIENLPYKTIDGKQRCNGHSPTLIERIIKEAGVGFCLDIGHGICAANSAKTKPFVYLRKFMRLKPVMFHLSDGDVSSENDGHLHLGHGDFNIPNIIRRYIPATTYVTLETRKTSPDNLADFREDLKFFRSIRRSRV